MTGRRGEGSAFTHSSHLSLLLLQHQGILGKPLLTFCNTYSCHLHTSECDTAWSITSQALADPALTHPAMLNYSLSLTYSLSDPMHPSMHKSPD